MGRRAGDGGRARGELTLERNEMQTVEVVEVRFSGEMFATYTDDSGAYTLYRTPENLYRIHIDEGECGLA